MARPGVKEGLAAIHIDRPALLLQLFQFGTRELEEMTADITWLHQDDQPQVEFSAPKALYAGPMLTTNVAGFERFKGDPREVVRDYDASRQDAAFYQALGMLWRYQLRFDAARDALERAVALDPSSISSWEELGQLYVRLRQPVRGREALARALALDPARAQAYRLLARMARQEHQLSEAQRLYERSASL